MIAVIVTTPRVACAVYPGNVLRRVATAAAVVLAVVTVSLSIAATLAVNTVAVVPPEAKLILCAPRSGCIKSSLSEAAIAPTV